MNSPEQESQLEALKELMSVCLKTTYKARESDTKVKICVAAERPLVNSLETITVEIHSGTDHDH